MLVNWPLDFAPVYFSNSYLEELNGSWCIIWIWMHICAVVQSPSRVWYFATPWTAACQASLSFSISQSLLRLIVLWVSNAIQLSHPLLSPSPLALSLFQHQGLFQWVGSSHQVAKVLELQIQHQCVQFQCILWLISFRMEWFDLLEVQGTLKSLLQCHNSKL